VAAQPWARARVKPPLVQILVVVAHLRTRALKTAVGKDSMRTGVGHGLVDPKRWGSSLEHGATRLSAIGTYHRKVIGLIFPNRDADKASRLRRQRKRTRRRRREPWEEFSFLLNGLPPWNQVGWR